MIYGQRESTLFILNMLMGSVLIIVFMNIKEKIVQEKKEINGSCWLLLYDCIVFIERR